MSRSCRKYFLFCSSPFKWSWENKTENTASIYEQEILIQILHQTLFEIWLRCMVRYSCGLPSSILIKFSDILSEQTRHTTRYNVKWKSGKGFKQYWWIHDNYFFAIDERAYDFHRTIITVYFYKSNRVSWYHVKTSPSFFFLLYDSLLIVRIQKKNCFSTSKCSNFLYLTSKECYKIFNARMISEI